MGTAGRGQMTACWRGHAGALLCALLVAGCAGPRAENGPADAPSPSASATGAETRTTSAEPFESAAPSVNPAPSATPDAGTAPSAMPTPSTAQEGDAGVVLEPEGLGIAALGDPAEDVIEALTGVYGPPNEDSGWGYNGGVCTDTLTRSVAFDRLYVYLSEGPTEYGAAGQRHLLGYHVVAGSEDWASEYGKGPQTAEGIGVGSTLADLRAAYGDGVTTSTEGLRYGTSFFITDSGGTQLFHGSMAVAFYDGTERVYSFVNGDFCGL